MKLAGLVSILIETLALGAAMAACADAVESPIEADRATVVAHLRANTEVPLSDAAIDRIIALTTQDNDTTRIEHVSPDSQGRVTVSDGAEVVFVHTSDAAPVTVHPPKNVPVIIFHGHGGVTATIDDGAVGAALSDAQVAFPAGGTPLPDPARVVVGTSGNDTIVVADAKPTSVVLGSGTSTVTAGGGSTVVEAGAGNATVVGGDGYAIVKLAGGASDYQVTTQNGHAIVTNGSTHKITDISKIQYVQLDNGNALVFAKDSTEAAVAELYHVAFGREADAGGLDYWFDLAKAGATLRQIAQAFAQSAEYQPHATSSDAEFIQGLYQNTFARTGEAVELSYWLDALAHGETRADVMADFATLAAQNIAHTAPNEEAQVVGSVQIVTGII